MIRILSIWMLLILTISCQDEQESEQDRNKITYSKQVKEKLKKEKVAEVDTLITRDKYYNQAYNELIKMLEGKKSLSFKRAAFLVEWAYLKGNLDYDKFCVDISRIVGDLNQFIDQKGVRTYKTAGNYALFEFFTKPHPMNNNQPFTYDFSDFYGGENWTSIFVTKLMKTHQGQCRSLPYLYKILAEEMKTEAHLALGPNHCYIKHLGEDGKWVNIELTNGNFATDAWMISSMDISAEAIKKRIYMDALSLRESVAYCLTDLGQGYKREYGHLDDFILACYNATLKYYPHSIHTLMLKYNTMGQQGLDYIKKHGRKETPKMLTHHKVFKETERKIDSLGFYEMSAKNYKEWVESMEIEKQKRNKNQ